MVKICQIIGYFKQPNNAFYMKRTIMKNFSNEKYKFFLFIQDNMRYIYTNNYLENKDNVTFFKNNNELKLLLKDIDYIILTLDLEHWWQCIYDFNPTKIFYIAHGVTNHCADYNFCKNIYKNWSYNKINLCLVSQVQYNIVSSLKKNVFKINTIPQFDNYLCKQPLKDNNILIIDNGNLNFVASASIDVLNKSRFEIYKILMQDFSKMSIYYKGWGHDYNRDNIIKSFPNIKNITYKNNLIYDYFFCDIIICIHFSTAYIEALLNNSKVIFITFDLLHNLDEKNDRFIYFSSFNSEKYPHLLFAPDLSTLEKHLNTIKTNPNYFETEEYLKDKNQFIKDSIGEYIPNVSKQLIDIIEKVEANN